MNCSLFCKDAVYCVIWIDCYQRAFIFQVWAHKSKQKKMFFNKSIKQRFLARKNSKDGWFDSQSTIIFLATRYTCSNQSKSVGEKLQNLEILSDKEQTSFALSSLALILRLFYCFYIVMFNFSSCMLFCFLFFLLLCV